MGLIALGTLLVIGVGYSVIQGHPPWSSLGTSGVRVAVLPFLDMTYRPEAVVWPFAVQQHLADELRTTDDLIVLNPDSLNDLIRSRVGTAQARRGRWLFTLMEELNVDYLVDGGVFIDGQEYLLRGQLIQRWSAEVLFTDTEEFLGEQDLEAAADRLGAAIRSYLEDETATRGD